MVIGKGVQYAQHCKSENSKVAEGSSERGKQANKQESNPPGNWNKIIEINKPFLNKLILPKFNNKDTDIVGLVFKTISNCLFSPRNTPNW